MLAISIMVLSLVFSGCTLGVNNHTISPTPILASPTVTQPLLTPTLTSSPTESPEIPETLPPYDRMNMGSAGTLTGNVVLINIFLSDEESYLNDEERQEVMDRLDEMAEWFYYQIEKYDKELNIIYNLDDLSIDYHSDSILIPRPGAGSEYDSTWGFDVMYEVYTSYDIGSLLERYNADNYAFIMHINKPGRSYAQPISYEYRDWFAYKYGELTPEFCVIFNRNRLTLRETVPHTYAHEVLHLFGAIDLYYPNNPLDERFQLALEYAPDEIMRRLHDDISRNTISNLTAYLIGWTDHLEERYKVFIEEYKLG